MHAAYKSVAERTATLMVVKKAQTSAARSYWDIKFLKYAAADAYDWA